MIIKERIITGEIVVILTIIFVTGLEIYEIAKIIVEDYKIDYSKFKYQKISNLIQLSLVSSALVATVYKINVLLILMVYLLTVIITRNLERRDFETSLGKFTTKERLIFLIPGMKIKVIEKKI